MKVEFSSKEFKTNIKKLAKVKSVKGVVDTENYKLHGYGNNLYITRFNKNLEVTARIDAKVEEKGVISLSPSTIKLIEKLPEGKMILTENTITINNKKVEYSGMYCDSKTMAHEWKSSFIIPNSELARLLEVSFAMAKDQARPALQGICFNKNETVALDGYRLSLRKSDYNFNSSFILCAECVEYLKSVVTRKTKNDACVMVNDKLAMFETGNLSITCELLQQEFIKYEQLINDEYRYLLTIDNTDELVNSIGIVKDLSGIGKFIIAENKIALKGADAVNKYTEELSIKNLEITGREDLVIGFNNRYMLDAIKALKNEDEKELIIRMLSSVSPIVIGTSKAKELVLPLRLTGKEAV